MRQKALIFQQNGKMAFIHVHTVFETTENYKKIFIILQSFVANEISPICPNCVSI